MRPLRVLWWERKRRPGHASDADLNDAVDGRVAPEGRIALEEHIRACADCGNDARALTELKIAARASATDIHAPPTLWHAVAAATIYASAHSAYVRRTFRWRRALLLGVVAAGSCLATAWLVDPCRGDPRTARAAVAVNVRQCESGWFSSTLQALAGNLSASIRAGRKGLSHLGRSRPSVTADSIAH